MRIWKGKVVAVAEDSSAASRVGDAMVEYLATMLQSMATRFSYLNSEFGVNEENLFGNEATFPCVSTVTSELAAALTRQFNEPTVMLGANVNARSLIVEHEPIIQDFYVGETFFDVGECSNSKKLHSFHSGDEWLHVEHEAIIQDCYVGEPFDVGECSKAKKLPSFHIDDELLDSMNDRSLIVEQEPIIQECLAEEECRKWKKVAPCDNGSEDEWMDSILNHALLYSSSSTEASSTESEDLSSVNGFSSLPIQGTRKYNPTKRYLPRRMKPFRAWYRAAKKDTGPRTFKTPVAISTVVDLDWIRKLYRAGVMLDDSHCDVLINLLIFKRQRAPEMFIPNWTCVEFSFWLSSGSSHRSSPREALLFLPS